MADTRTLEERLASSQAFRTLRAEREVVNSLGQLGWDARHSPFYKDMATGKPRELDAIGRRIWEGRDSIGPMTARVNLFVEVKSNRDFHVLCAGQAMQSRRFEGNEYWLGYCERTLANLASAAAEFGLKPSEARDFMHGVEKICFPKDTMRVAPFRIDAMPAKHSFTAFRETNTSLEKDLDNSVLWRAVSALRSAVSSARGEIIEGIIGDARVDMEVARRHKKSVVTHAGVIHARSAYIDFYVPIVAIESRLWSAESPEPVEIEWFRLVENNLLGGSENWTDVVNLAHLNTYLSAVTAYFKRTFADLGATETDLSLQTQHFNHTDDSGSP